ncbi:MAG: starch-binding protein, partial [Muribaculaceae bacterium]|nr:starch-binding protein [Muribaculaceae bacterium]
AYFIAPKSWTKCNVWVWSNTTGTNFTTSGTWPGDPINYVGNTSDGSPVYQWIGPDIDETDRTEFIIFNNGSTQTADLDYVAGGVYNLSGKLLYTVPNPGGNTPIPGDVNGDGDVTAADVTALYDFLLTNDITNLVNGDQNGDGDITSADVTAVYDILLGV